MKDRGKFREVDVRFGSPADQDLFAVPKHHEVNLRIINFASDVCYLIKRNYVDLDDYCEIMAKIHHKFICLHPFFDGNGRIGRIIIDQLALAFGLPMVMGGYPRTNEEQRKIYHKAIREASIGDNYLLLKHWIREKIERNFASI